MFRMIEISLKNQVNLFIHLEILKIKRKKMNLSSINILSVNKKVSDLLYCKLIITRNLLFNISLEQYDQLKTIDDAKSSYQHPKSESMAILPESSRIFQENLRKERRAHTLAPSQIITGPIDCPASTIFSSLKCSMNIQPSKPVSQQKQRQTTEILSYSKSELSISDHDNQPIIVKVRYDPTIDTLPSEQAIRQLIDHRLQQTIIKRKPEQPMVLNFFNRIDHSKFQQTKPQSFPSVSHSISDNSRPIHTSTTVQHRSNLLDPKSSSIIKNYSKNSSKLRNVSKDSHLPPKPSISHLIIEKTHNQQTLPNRSKSSYQSNNNTHQGLFVVYLGLFFAFAFLHLINSIERKSYRFLLICELLFP